MPKFTDSPHVALQALKEVLISVKMVTGQKSAAISLHPERYNADGLRQDFGYKNGMRVQ